MPESYISGQINLPTIHSPSFGTYISSKTLNFGNDSDINLYKRFANAILVCVSRSYIFVDFSKELFFS